ncbi:oligopeptide/dipeptide ABC transporter ATP-binding protein [Kribbella sp. CA-245084]|uniref:oligopeptide/dipeptide ABC transporter ATP-binding protein n=1 Tax=Kribbella sp. CA-245084 TaxID=3239940 RepID=UPI003D93F346
MTDTVKLENVVKHFPLRRRGFGRREFVHSVDDVTLSLAGGQSLGIVGESGSGKSTLARIMLGLQAPDSGRVDVAGVQVTRLKRKDDKAFRRKAQIVFQDPHSVMDPRMTIRHSLVAVLAQHQIGDGEEREARAVQVLREVGLEPEYLDRYPSDCSGGQLQRVVIARALLLEPTVLVCDEPTSALDASVQAKVLNLIGQLRRERELTMVLISHDLRVVRLTSDRVAVMYLGQVVETADREAVFTDARHPYTLALLAAATHRKGDDRVVAQGEPPSPVHPPAGCRFNTRCPLATDQCRQEAPQPTEVSPGHEVRCHRWSESRQLLAEDNES